MPDMGLCKECNEPWSMEQGQYDWFLSEGKEKGLTLPKRCPECRKKGKIRRQAGPSLSDRFLNLLDSYEREDIGPSQFYDALHNLIEELRQFEQRVSKGKGHHDKRKDSEPARQ